MNYDTFQILNEHLENGAVHYQKQSSIEGMKNLVFNGLLINLHNRDNLNGDMQYTVLTKKGFDKIVKYRCDNCIK